MLESAMSSRISVIALGVCLPLVAAAAQPRVEVVTTDHADFAAGGLIRLEGASGEVNIVGWDSPAVEIVTTRYTFSYDKARATERLNAIKVTKESAGPGELKIVTTHQRLRGLHVDYQIHVPRDSRLLIHHEIGDVVVFDVSGGIEATTRIGDIVVQLPEPAHYTIDASARIGGVYSDFDDAHRERLTGRQLTQDVPAADAKAPARQVKLHVGLGGITIQKSSPEGPGPATTAPGSRTT